MKCTSMAFRRPSRLFLIATWILGAFCAPTLAFAQAAPSPYTTGYRYDAMSRLTGIIMPDPDGNTGTLKYAAIRRTYDAAGRQIKEEAGELSSWQSDTILPVNWTGFTILSTTETTYDVVNRKSKVVTKGADIVPTSMLQFSYDGAGRLECTAQRMNPAVYSSLTVNACSLGTQGSPPADFGPDRISRTIYDAAGQVLKTQKAYATALQEDYATYTYSANGKQISLTDARGYTASMTYDGHDRQTRWNFPSKTTSGVVSTTDYEEYGYDANRNRTSLRKRDGSIITYQYDALNRNIVKIVPDRADLGPNQVRDVYYSYDLHGLQTSARYDSASGDGVVYSYDGFGRQTGATITLYGSTYTLAYGYDKNSNRIQLTHPDGVVFDYSYDGLDRAESITQGSTVIAGLSYNNRGTRAGLSGNVPTTYGYDPVGRLNGLSHNIGGAAILHDVTYGFTRTPASQLASQTRDNDVYAWTGHYNVDRSYTTNGLNQYTAAGSTSFCYDANGNLTADGATVYKYDVENRLVEAWVQTNSDCAALVYAGTQRAALRYDPLGRLFMYGGNLTEPSLRFVYDGDALIAEYSQVAPRPMLRRYVYGPKVDEPLAWYEGTTVAVGALRRLRADHQGSVVVVTDQAGALISINSYDEYGIPAASNVGTFQYTGQMWLRDIGMYHYKARLYSPTLGRFMQTDPIGYEDQVNLYAYVGSDPVNATDPSGTEEEDEITVTAWPKPLKLIPDWIFPGTADNELWAKPATERVVRGFKRIGDIVCSYLCSTKDEGDEPADQDVDKVKGDKAADEAAQSEGFANAHDAKDGRGDSQVNIYKDRKTGKYWLWDGKASSEKDPL